MDAIATRAFAVVAGLGGVALLVIHYRRQRTTEADAVRAEAANVRAELAAEREVAKLFTDTFDSASSKLGDEHAAVRLAGVHALARLADEAPEGREDLVQMVIDVLCAYLRMPYTPSPDDPSEQPERPVLPPVSPTTAVDLGPLHGTAPDEARREKQQAAQEERRKRGLEFASFREVRHTIIRIIGSHLREPTRWRGKNYDFTGVVFDGGDLHGAVDFNWARFTGATVDFGEAEFSSGKVTFRRAGFTGGTVSFEGASGTCPKGLVEAMERAESVVALPECWQRTAEGRGEVGAPETSADAPDH
ncbi:pentapeptide repeat-containing protein [Nocardiopsis flavescens]